MLPVRLCILCTPFGFVEGRSMEDSGERFVARGAGGNGTGIAGIMVDDNDMEGGRVGGIDVASSEADMALGNRLVRPTGLTLGVRAADEARGAYDAFCKRVLAERQVAAYVLCDLLDEFAGEDYTCVARECIDCDPAVDVSMGLDAPARLSSTHGTDGGPGPEVAGVVGETHDGIARDGGGEPAGSIGVEVGTDVQAGGTPEKPVGRRTDSSGRPVGDGADGFVTADPGPALLLESEETTMFEGTVRFDVRLRVRVPSSGAMIEVDLEPQDDFHPGYPLVYRAFFYVARMLSRQGATVVPHSDYGALRKVVSIWVCTSPPKGKSGKVLRYRQCYRYDPDDPKEAGAYKPSVHERSEIVFVYLGPKARGKPGVVGMLDALLAKDLSADEKLAMLGNKYGMLLQEPIEREVRKMEDYWTKLYKRGVADGERIGRADGERIGRADGERIGAAKNLVKVVHNIAESLSAPVDAVLDLACASDEDRRVVHAALGE